MFDKIFAGSIPKIYDEYLVPLIFEPFAVEIVKRIKSHPISNLLEIAAGTGVVTRLMASQLPENVAIVATDLNQAMLDYAVSKGTQYPIVWRQADAMSLPFDEETFDAVICQFGAMFFPDKAKAFSETRRVLKSGGIFIFSVWDRIEENEIAETVTKALESIFPNNPPRFLVRTPHGYHDPTLIEHDLAAGGFKKTAKIETVSFQIKAPSAHIAAMAYCQGTPLRSEIEAHNGSRLGEVTEIASAAIAKRFGKGPVVTKIQAHIINVEN